MSEFANLYAAGVPLFTLRDSLTIHRAGGVTVFPAANGRSVGQRSDVKVTGIGASVYPIADADAGFIRSLLRKGGPIPVILPDGRRFACAPTSGGHSMGGNYTQQSDTYQVNWDVVPNACLVDVPWRGAYPGDMSFARYTQQSALSFSAGWTLFANSGWQATGTGAYGTRYIKETAPFLDPDPRPQPVLTAEITIPVGVTVALGLGDTSLPIPTTALPSGSIGVEITPTAFQVIAPGVTTSVARVNSTTRYKVVIVARPLLARITVWEGEIRRMLVNAVPFSLPTVNFGPMVHVKTGLVTWNGWSLLAQ